MFKLLNKLLQMSVLQTFVFLNVFFMALFRFADVSTKDLIAILIVANVQISLGGLIWARLIRRESIDLVEFVGMGGALGFGLSLISSQLFRSLAPFSVSWLILPLLWLVTSHLKSGVTSGVLFVKLQNTNDMLLICSGTLIALSTAWYWLVSTAVVVFLWDVLRYLRGSNRARGFSQSKFQTVTKDHVAHGRTSQPRPRITLTEILNARNLSHGSILSNIAEQPTEIPRLRY